MAESIAVIVVSDRPRTVHTALDLVEAAVAMEMEAHVYFTGDGVIWVGHPGDGGPNVPDVEAARDDVARRLREIKDDGTVHVYACSRAMQACNISRDDLVSEVDMPAGWVYFLEVAGEAKLTLTF